MSLDLKIDAQGVADDTADMALAFGAVAAGATVTAAALAVPTVGTGAIAAGAVAVFAGLDAALLALVSDAAQDVADDPPRADHHLVTKFKPRRLQLPPAPEADASLLEFVRIQIELVDAISSLITSFERLDGARAELRGGGEPKVLVRRIVMQRRAIRCNAKAAKERCQLLLGLRVGVNAAWRNYAAALRETLKAASPQELQQAAEKTLDVVMVILGQNGVDAARLQRMQTKLRKPRKSPELPDAILDPRWVKALSNFQKRLATFAGERLVNPLHRELERPR